MYLKKCVRFILDYANTCCSFTAVYKKLCETQIKVTKDILENGIVT